MTREEAIQVISNIIHDDISVYGHKDKPRNIALAMAIEALREQRPRGEWIWKEYDPDYDCGDIVCSKCSVVIYEGVPQVRLKATNWPFCPDCGADMRKRGETE